MHEFDGPPIDWEQRVKPKFIKHRRTLAETRALYTQRWHDQIEGTPAERDIPLALYLRRNARKPGTYFTPAD